MTLDELYADIENLQSANLDSWEFCGNLAERPWYEGFDAACNEILKIIAAREEEEHGL